VKPGLALHTVCSSPTAPSPALRLLALRLGMAQSFPRRRNRSSWASHEASSRGSGVKGTAEAAIPTKVPGATRGPGLLALCEVVQNAGLPPHCGVTRDAGLAAHCATPSPNPLPQQLAAAQYAGGGQGRCKIDVPCSCSVLVNATCMQSRGTQLGSLAAPPQHQGMLKKAEQGEERVPCQGSSLLSWLAIAPQLGTCPLRLNTFHVGVKKMQASHNGCGGPRMACIGGA